MRKVKHHLILSIGSERDFLALVRSASGVNIAMEVGWLFEPGRSSPNAMGSCFLRLLPPQAEREERLQLLLDDLSLQVKD